MPHTIVKLGGSLYGTAELDALLATATRRGAVVAPGGGYFADAVRAAQSVRGFDDRAAHAMAIRAMEQAARMLAARAPGLALCASSADFAAARTAGRGALWLPAAMAIEADVPASWDVTSDSLAMWLALTLGGERIVFLKAAAVSPQLSGPEAWAAAGLVDPYLPALARSFAGEAICIGPATPAALDKALAAPMRRAA